MKISVSALLVSLSCLATTNVWAQDDESYTNYESIVNELKASAEENPEPEQPDLNWDEVSLHGGMAFVTDFYDIEAGRGATQGVLKGFEAHAGANLFTRKVRAEIAFRNFVPENYSTLVNLSLRELQARMIFLAPMTEDIFLRMGFGLSARYMDLDLGDFHGSETIHTGNLILGAEYKVARAVSLGWDMAYHSAFTRTFDKSGWNSAIRLNATF